MTSPNRTLTRLVAGALLLLAMAPARAQYPDDPRLFPPGDAQDGQLFARADPSAYGGRLHPGPHTGFFFEFDVLAWSIQNADVTTIGVADSARTVWLNNDAGETEQRSDTTTGAMRTAFATGERFEFGYAGDHNGWLCNVTRLGPMDQRLDAGHADMVFDDPVQGQQLERYLQGGYVHVPLAPDDPNMPHPTYMPAWGRILNVPTTFDTLSATQKTDMWNVELLYMRRFRQLDHGGNIEFYLGARYMEFNEKFNVSATGGALADSFWNTDAQNHIIGPEIGGKWSKQTGRWKFAVGGRFTAGMNMQNARQEGELGSNLIDATKGMPQTIGFQQTTTPLPLTPTAGQAINYFVSGTTTGGQPIWTNNVINNAGTIWYMTPTAFKSEANDQVFSPIVEVKAEIGFQLTRSVLFKAAWNGMWVDGLARPSSLVRYRVPDMGIDMSKNFQDAVLTGVNIGVEINR